MLRRSTRLSFVLFITGWLITAAGSVSVGTSTLCWDDGGLPSTVALAYQSGEVFYSSNIDFVNTATDTLSQCFGYYNGSVHPGNGYYYCSNYPQTYVARLYTNACFGTGVYACGNPPYELINFYHCCSDFHLNC